MSTRKKIPKEIKDTVWKRQYGRCACCISQARHFHHVLPVALGGSNESKNIVFLCEKHHGLLHLGDLETCLTILEYVYYLQNGKLPTDNEEIREMAEKIKEENIKVYQKIN